jgi:hypothetical protein
LCLPIVSETYCSPFGGEGDAIMLGYRLLLVCAVVISVLGAPLQAQKKAGGGGANTLYPVTATFRCPLTLECLTLDGIEGDMLGAYRGTTPDGAATTPEGTVTNNGAYFTEANLLVFALKAGLGRFISFDFSRPLGVAPCSARRTCRMDFTNATTDHSVPGSRTYPVGANGVDLPNGFIAIPIGGAARARFFVNFLDPKGRELLWTVRFDPALYPGSTFLTVTRPAENVWTVEAGGADVAQLVSATTANGKTVTVNEGYYVMPFRITIVR